MVYVMEIIQVVRVARMNQLITLITMQQLIAMDAVCIQVVVLIKAPVTMIQRPIMMMVPVSFLTVLVLVVV